MEVIKESHSSKRRKVPKDLLLEDDDEGPYGRLVTGRISHVLRKFSTRIGVVSDGHPSWAWYVGCLGEMQWIYSKHDLLGRLPNDPPWYQETVDAEQLPPVDTVLVQGRWPERSSAIWKMKELRLVLRFSSERRRGGRMNRTLPSEWKCTTLVLRHDVLGGVSNASSRLYCANRIAEEEITLESPKGLPTNLCQVLQPATELKVFKWVAIPEEGSTNTGKGLLNWKDRFDEVVAPSVYSKAKWVSRKMTMNEAASVLDFPNTRVDVMTDLELQRLTKSELPGKILVAGLEQLRIMNERKDWNSKRVREEVECDPNPSIGKRRITEKGVCDPVCPVHAEIDVETVEDEYEDDDVEALLDTSAPDAWELHRNMNQVNSPSIVEAKIGLSTVTDKAVKSDDASIPVHLWNDRIAVGLQSMREKEKKAFPFDFTKDDDCLRFQRGLDGLRKFGLIVWKKNVRMSFLEWYDEVGKLRREKEDIFRDGMKACAKADQCSWWNWDKGSSIFFWRWPPDYQETARIGVMPYFDKAPPTNQDRQPKYQDDVIKEMIKDKLQNVIDKGYIEITDLESMEAGYDVHVPCPQGFGYSNGLRWLEVWFE